MRISDWSSDVCSSDLKAVFASFGLKRGNQRLGLVERGEAIALVSVEHGVGLEHTPVLGVSSAFGVLDFLGVALVENRDGRLLALAYLSAKFLALAVGHPVRRSEAAAIGHHPQPEGVHASIWRDRKSTRLNSSH